MVGHKALIEGALSEEEHARLISLLKEAMPGFRQELQEAVQRLRAMLEGMDSLAVLARFVAANIVIFWGEYFEPAAEGSEAKVEFVAGLLTSTTTYGDQDPPDAHAVQAVMDEVDNVFDIAHLLNLAEGTALSGPENLAEIRYASRAQWLEVRGPSYEHHARDLAHAIYDELGDSMRKRLGFNLSDLISVEQALRSLLEQRFNALIRRAGQAAPGLAADPGIQAMAKEQARTPSALELEQLAFLYVWEQGVTRALSFDREDLVQLVPEVPDQVVSRLLDRLTIECGSLAAEAYSSPFDRNPLEQRPIVRRDSRYMLPVPGMIAREYPTIVEPDMLREYKQFDRRRAKVLDRLAVGYLAEALSGSVAHVGLFYPIFEGEVAKNPECDGLILFDRVAIVVEGKGSSLSTAARRGDVKRAQSDLQRSIEAAALQGSRVKRYLLSGAPATFYDTRGEEVLRVEPGSVDVVHIINPTLHQLADYGMHPVRLRAMGLNESERAWSVYINDLRIITEVIENPAELLHYMTWRSRLPLGERVFAIDEIDLFGSYLLRQQFRELEDDATGHITVTGSSTDFDTYYMGQTGHGPRSKKPQMFSISAVRAFVKRMSRDRPPGWLDAAGVCLDLSLGELAFLEVEMRRSRPRDEDWVRWGTFERCTVIMLSSAVSWRQAWEQFRTEREPTERIIFVDTRGKRARLVWALSGA